MQHRYAFRCLFIYNKLWLGVANSVANLVKAGEIDRETILGLILPYLPNKHTAPYPTFLQWCRRHRGDDPPLGPAAAHILADPERLRGRRPLAAWEDHWKRLKTPPDMLEHLHAAWSAYQADFRP